MADMLVPIAPLVVAVSFTIPGSHIFREFAKVVLKPIGPRPSTTIPPTPSTPSRILGDDGRWFLMSLFDNAPASAFTPEPTPLLNQTVLPQTAAPKKNLDHLPNLLSSNPAHAETVFVFILTSYCFIQFFARHLKLRRRFSPVTHIVSSAITVYIYTLIGPASRGALLNMPVTLQQAKESVLPLACATLAAFSVFNTLIIVVESVLRRILFGIEVSAFSKSAKKNLQGHVLLVVLAPVFYRLYQVHNGLLPFEATVGREISNNLSSVDPRFVAIVTMAFVALCVVDMLLGFLQAYKIPLRGLSVSTLTCGPVVLVINKEKYNK